MTAWRRNAGDDGTAAASVKEAIENGLEMGERADRVAVPVTIADDQTITAGQSGSFAPK